MTYTLTRLAGYGFTTIATTSHETMEAAKEAALVTPHHQWVKVDDTTWAADDVATDGEEGWVITCAKW